MFKDLWRGQNTKTEGEATINVEQPMRTAKITITVYTPGEQLREDMVLKTVEFLRGHGFDMRATS